MSYEKQGKILTPKVIESFGIVLCIVILLITLFVGRVMARVQVKPYSPTMTEITEPSDLQPALGYRVYQDAVSPQGFTSKDLRVVNANQ